MVEARLSRSDGRDISYRHVSSEGRCNIVCKLRRALRAERRRGVAGHWTYDLARHVELLRLYRLELASSGLRDIKRN